MTRSALDVVTVDVGTEDRDKLDRIPVRAFLSRVRAHEEREPLESLHAAISVYRVETAISCPPLKLVADTVRISQSTATRLMSRARDSGLAPEVRIQEPRRAPAVDPYNPGRPLDPGAPHRGSAQPGGPSIELPVGVAAGRNDRVLTALCHSMSRLLSSVVRCSLLLSNVLVLNSLPLSASPGWDALRSGCESS